jgi:hypothetical protein
MLGPTSPEPQGKLLHAACIELNKLRNVQLQKQKVIKRRPNLNVLRRRYTRLLEQSGGANRPGGRELAGLGDVQTECADHSRRDDGEVDAIHRPQPRTLGIVPGARSVWLPTFV